MGFFDRIFGKKTSQTETHYSTAVFKTNGVPEFTFVTRDLIEESLDRTTAERNRLLLFLGYSKSGKTVYRKTYFDRKGLKQVIFRCNRDSSPDQLYSFICTEARLPFPGSVARSESTGSEMEIKASAKAGPTEAGVTSKDQQQRAIENLGHYPSIPIDTNYICNNLRDENTIIVLEDFHLVNDAFAARISEDLKHFLDEGILFLIIGIPSSPGRTLRNNPDLGGRTERVVFDYLLDEEIAELITKGEEKLNVRFSEQVRCRVIENSMHNAFLVQSICQRLVLTRHINKTAHELTKFSDPKEVDAACSEIADSLASDFGGIVEVISSGQRKQKENKAYNQYEEILRTVRDTPIHVLENGVTYTFIGQHTWQQFSPEKIKTRIDSGNYKDENSFKMALNNQISQALNRIDDTFSRANTRPVLIYNENKLFLMDIVFKFFLEWRQGVISDISQEPA